MKKPIFHWFDLYLGYETSVAATKNFTHRGNFARSIYWQIQNQSKICPTGSKILIPTKNSVFQQLERWSSNDRSFFMHILI